MDWTLPPRLHNDLRGDATTLHSVLARPLPRGRLVPRAVGLVEVRDVGHERVVRVRRAEERLDRKQHGADLECWGPFVCGERG